VGKRSAGTVTGFAPYGCFVRFFGDVKGMAHATEMDLPAGKKPSDCYEVGQVCLSSPPSMPPPPPPGPHAEKLAPFKPLRPLVYFLEEAVEGESRR